MEQGMGLRSLILGAVLAASAALSTACSDADQCAGLRLTSPPSARALVLHGDVRFTDEERDRISCGVSFMSEHTGRELAVVFDGTGECLSGHLTRSAYETGGQYERSTCMRLGVAPDAIPLEIIAAHEVAHYLGMGHVEAGLMQPWDPPGLAWSEQDEAECRRAGVCRSE